MGKIIALVNQKGGVGKTTTSINLAASLGYFKRRVLLVDLDPQGNTTTGVGISKADVHKSVYDLLLDKADIHEVIRRTGFQNLSVIPATINLVSASDDLMEQARMNPGLNRQLQLKKYLDQVKEEYDYILIDCPPSLGLLVINALAAADSVIIPLQSEFFALEGIMQLLNTIRVVQKGINPNLTIEGVVLTMFNSNTKLGLEVAEDTRSYFKECVYDTIIPRVVKLAEAPSYGKPVLYYDSMSKGAEAYLNLAKEVIERNGK